MHNPDEYTNEDALLEEFQDALQKGDRRGATRVARQLLANLPSREEKAPIRWNEDPEWHAYVSRYESDIAKIANKKTMDESLRDDCAQEARIALYTIFPEKVRGYGVLDKEAFDKALDRYCRNAIRNAILSYLDSVKTGPWYIGRTRNTKNADGDRVRTHFPPRYSSLDELVEVAGLQVDTDGDVSWEHTVTAGIDVTLSEDQQEMSDRHRRGL